MQPKSRRHVSGLGFFQLGIVIRDQLELQKRRAADEFKRAFAFRDTGSIPPRGGDLVPLASSIFTDFAFPFEVASVLLLAAMIGAIVLVKRE